MSLTTRIKGFLFAAALAVGLLFGPSIVRATSDGYDALRQAMVPSGGIYTTSLPTLTTGEHNELHLDSSARLIVSVGATTAGTTTQEVVGDVADGIATAGNPVLIGGQDGTLTQSIKTDSSGELQVDVLTMPADATELPAAAALADNAANPTTPTIGAGLLAFDGATWDRVTNGGGVEATALRVTVASDSTGLLSVDDNGASLTVDNATLSVVGGGAEATAIRVTLANDSTGLVSVDDNGGNISVDWAGTVPPIGAGTEAAALRVTLATDSTGVVSVDDNGANLSIDFAGVDPPIGAGTEAAALRVTLATDSTGVVSVDDNGASLTVDAAGDAAHDAADVGNPIKIGGKAIAGAVATAVSATNDRADAHFDMYGRLVTRPSGSWAVQHTPAANTQATIPQAAGTAGVKNVCTAITVTFSGNGSSAAAVGTVFNLRDGTTGAGTILWSGTIWLTATAGDHKSITISGLWIEGTAATAMTLEAAAAGGANTVQSVAMSGTITQ